MSCRPTDAAFAGKTVQTTRININSTWVNRGSQRLKPSLRPTAIRIVSSLKRRSHYDTGKANNQSLLCGDLMAMSQFTCSVVRYAMLVALKFKVKLMVDYGYYFALSEIKMESYFTPSERNRPTSEPLLISPNQWLSSMNQTERG